MGTSSFYSLERHMKKGGDSERRKYHLLLYKGKAQETSGKPMVMKPGRKT